MFRRRRSFTTTSCSTREELRALSEQDARALLNVVDSLSGLRPHTGSLSSTAVVTSRFSSDRRRGSKKNPIHVYACDDDTPDYKDQPVILAYTGAAYLGATGIDIRQSDLACFKNGNELNDAAVNVGLRMWWADMTARSARNFHIFPSYFFSKLRAYGFSGVTKWYPKDILDKKYMIIPVHEGRHWFLAIVCLRPKLYIFTLDSLGGANRSVPPRIHAFLVEVAVGSDHAIPPLLDDTHKVVKVPKQSGSVDCGIYMLYFARTFLDDASLWVQRMSRRCADEGPWGTVQPVSLRQELYTRLESLL